jgi:hypothetical protein
MSTLVTIVIVVAVLIAAVLIYAATRPDMFVVQRTTRIKAAPDKIYPFINDFHLWGQWSPWENKDPAMKRTFSGAQNGTGAVYAWEGNKNVGSGRMEIVETSPSSRVTIKLDFIKPFEARNIAEFTFAPSADATQVKWAMRGPLPLFGKVMHLFINMDRMVGKDFDIGLANLKSISER